MELHGGEIELRDEPHKDYDKPLIQVVFHKQQRVRERDRRERQKLERLQREREQKEERELEDAMKQRIETGDLREQILLRVAEALRTEEVQATIARKSDERIQARRVVLMDEVCTEREVAIAAARRKEEERLSKQHELQNILKENASKVAAEAKRREEEEKRAKREREIELVRFREEQKRARQVMKG